MGWSYLAQRSVSPPWIQGEGPVPMTRGKMLDYMEDDRSLMVLDYMENVRPLVVLDCR